MKDRIKAVIGRRTLRRVSRLRWIAKYRLLRRYGACLRDDLSHNLAYVFWDPEVESHTYELDNEGELVAFAHELLGVPPRHAAAWIAETKQDPELNERLRAHVGFRLHAKRVLPLGNRLLWYVLTRALRPGLVVETGIYDGLGSLVLLRALERNAAEGRDGELISIDADPHAGWLVADRLRARWHRLTGLTSAVLAPALEARSVDLLIQDTPHTYDNQLHEFATALEHAADRLVLVDSGGGQTPALEEQVARHFGRREVFVEHPRRHFSPGRGTAVAVFERLASSSESTALPNMHEPPEP